MMSMTSGIVYFFGCLAASRGAMKLKVPLGMYGLITFRPVWSLRNSNTLGHFASRISKVTRLSGGWASVSLSWAGALTLASVALAGAGGSARVLATQAPQTPRARAARKIPHRA